MTRLRVYGLTSMRAGKQVRVIVATSSRRTAAPLFGVSLYHMREFGCETGNAQEVQVATFASETVFWAPLDDHPKQYLPLERAK